MSRRAHPTPGAREIRTFAATGVDMRAESSGQLRFTGYASVFDSPYPMYGGPVAGGWNEVVDRHAFDATLTVGPDVVLLINHEGLQLARTAHGANPGTMTLSVDDRGLKVSALLDPTDPDVMRIRPKMARGDLDEMSFAFHTRKDAWVDNGDTRRLLDLDLHRGDVSIVRYGASSSTSADLRSRSEGRRPGDWKALAPRAASGNLILTPLTRALYGLGPGPVRR